MIVKSLGVVLNMMQHLFHTFDDHLTEMKISVERLENEMEAQAHHFGVNLDIAGAPEDSTTGIWAKLRICEWFGWFRVIMMCLFTI